jgi:hypothetical protein
MPYIGGWAVGALDLPGPGEPAIELAAAWMRQAARCRVPARTSTPIRRHGLRRGAHDDGWAGASHVKDPLPRARLRSQGLRPVRIWIPSVTAEGFAAEAHRQSRLVAAGERWLYPARRPEWQGGAHAGRVATRIRSARLPSPRGHLRCLRACFYAPMLAAEDDQLARITARVTDLGGIWSAALCRLGRAYRVLVPACCPAERRCCSRLIVPPERHEGNRGHGRGGGSAGRALGEAGEDSPR